MEKLFKNGTLAFYSRLSKGEKKVCIVLDHMFTDDSHYFDNDGVSYFKVLLENKIETICDIWLEKISLT